MYDISWDRGRFIFDAICNITQEPRGLQRLCLWVHRQVGCDKIIINCCHKLLNVVISTLCKSNHHGHVSKLNSQLHMNTPHSDDLELLTSQPQNCTVLHCNNTKKTLEETPPFSQINTSRKANSDLTHDLKVLSRDFAVKTGVRLSCEATTSKISPIYYRSGTSE